MKTTLSEEEEEKIRKELLEHCYTEFIKNTEAVDTDKYVERILAFYSVLLNKIKNNMQNPEKRIGFHKILAGTTLSILMALQVKPHNYATIINWKDNPDVIRINVDFAVFTLGYFFTVKYMNDFKNKNISNYENIDMSNHKNRFFLFTKKYENACTELKTLLANIAKKMQKKEYPIDPNYVFLLSYKFFLLEELMKTFETDIPKVDQTE